MRVTIKVGDVSYWVDCKERWCRADLKRWDEATLGRTDEEYMRAVLTLLPEWCSALYVEDVEGKAYTRFEDLNEEVLNRLDAPAFSLLTNLPWRAFLQRERLGEA